MSEENKTNVTQQKANETQNKSKKKAVNAALKQRLAERFNGCPFMQEREKGSLDDITGIELTIEDIYALADYHAIIFEEVPEKFFLTGGALKNLCNEFERDEVLGLVIKLGEKIKTQNKRDFRPMEVIF